MEFPVQNYGLYNKLEPSRYSSNRPVPLLNLSSMRSPNKRFSNTTSNESQSPYSQHAIQRLQGAYRDSRHIPEELFENIPKESVRQLLEYMLNEKMSSDDFGAYGKGQPSMMSYTDTDFSKLNYNYSMATAMTNSYYLRRPTFPVAPRSNLRDEIRQRRYNNISTYQRGIRSVEINSPVENVQEESEVQTTQQSLQEDFEQLIQKFKEADEMLEEAREKKELLEKVLRLSKRRKEVGSKVTTGFKEMKKLREELIEEIAMNSKLKFLVQTSYSKDSSSYARNMQSFESSLDQSALIELAEKESLGGFSPSDPELQTLNSLKESLPDAKKFETGLYSILSTSEPGDFLNLLIKYIRFIDEEASGSIRQELVEVKNKIKVQQFLQEELSKEKVHSEESVGNLTERLRQLSKPSVSS
jgi:hypothetical protein